MTIAKAAISSILKFSMAAALAGAALTAPAYAEGTIRIVEQFGISYLPFHVIRDQQLIEKHGEAEGLDIEVEWTQLGGGAAANDALLSGSVDIVSAGVGPLLTIWDRTKGNAEVKGIASGIHAPFYLVTNNPEVNSIADLTEADKIALPSVGVSVQARTLQIAAAKEFGQENYDQLDAYTVTLPHPDATQALISNSGNITTHFSSVPFQNQALENPNVRKILDSYEVLGGPATSVAIYTTSAYREENPQTYAAFLAALEEAAAWIEANKEEAADTFIRVNDSNLSKEFILSILNDPQISFDPTPLRTEVYADFLHEIGAIENEAESWKDYFFEDIHELAGS
jgi:NitT/TauT family transport system substrate-binding protein